MGTKSARFDAAGERGRFLERSFPLSNSAICDNRQHPRTGVTSNLRGRTGLGDLRADGIRPQVMGYAVGGRAATWHAGGGIPRYRVAAPGEGVSILERRHSFGVQPIRGRIGLRRQTAE